MNQLDIDYKLSKGAAPATTAENGETKIQIIVGNQVLNGILYDNAETRQFIAMLPQSITMVGYGNREFYGGLEK